MNVRTILSLSAVIASACVGGAAPAAGSPQGAIRSVDLQHWRVTIPLSDAQFVRTVELYLDYVEDFQHISSEMPDITPSALAARRDADEAGSVSGMIADYFRIASRLREIEVQFLDKVEESLSEGQRDNFQTERFRVIRRYFLHNPITREWPAAERFVDVGRSVQDVIDRERPGELGIEIESIVRDYELEMLRLSETLNTSARRATVNHYAHDSSVLECACFDETASVSYEFLSRNRRWLLRFLTMFPASYGDELRNEFYEGTNQITYAKKPIAFARIEAAMRLEHDDATRHLLENLAIEAMRRQRSLHDSLGSDWDVYRSVSPVIQGARRSFTESMGVSIEEIRDVVISNTLRGNDIADYISESLESILPEDVLARAEELRMRSQGQAESSDRLPALITEVTAAPAVLLPELLSGDQLDVLISSIFSDPALGPVATALADDYTRIGNALQRRWIARIEEIGGEFAFGSERYASQEQVSAVVAVIRGARDEIQSLDRAFSHDLALLGDGIDVDQDENMRLLTWVCSIPRPRTSPVTRYEMSLLPVAMRFSFDVAKWYELAKQLRPDAPGNIRIDRDRARELESATRAYADARLMSWSQVATYLSRREQREETAKEDDGIIRDPFDEVSYFRAYGALAVAEDEAFRSLVSSGDGDEGFACYWSMLRLGDARAVYEDMERMYESANEKTDNEQASEALERSAAETKAKYCEATELLYERMMEYARALMADAFDARKLEALRGGIGASTENLSRMKEETALTIEAIKLRYGE